MNRQFESDSSPSRHALKSFVMVGLLLVALAAVGGYFIFLSPRKPMNAEEVLKNVRPYIVELEYDFDENDLGSLTTYTNLKESDFKKNVGFCTGFIVGRNLLLTAFHCLNELLLTSPTMRGAEDFIVKTDDGRRLKPLNLLWYDVARDYAFLEVPFGNFQFLDIVPDETIGRKVFTVGNVHGSGLAIREGIISSKTPNQGYENIEVLRYSAAASPGNSGGPLLNEFGEAVGLVFARGNISENYNMATLGSDLLQAKNDFVVHKKSDTVVTSMKQLYSKTTSLKEFYKEYGIKLTKDDIKGNEDALWDVRFETKVPVAVSALGKMIETQRLEAPKATVEKVLNRDIKYESPNNGGNEASHEVSWKGMLSEKEPLFVPYDTRGLLENEFTLLAPVAMSYQITPDYSHRSIQVIRYSAFLDKYATNENFQIFKTVTPRNENPETASYPKSELHYFVEIGQNMPLSSDHFRGVNEMAAKDFLLSLNHNGLWMSISSYLEKTAVLSNTTAGELELLDLPPNPIKAEIKDSFGRTWHTLEWPITSHYSARIFCMEMPKSRLCVTSNDFFYGAVGADSMSKEEFIERYLSQILLRPGGYWRDALVEDFLFEGLAQNLQGFDDIEIKTNLFGDTYLRMKTLDVTVRLPYKDGPPYIGIIPALIKTEDSHHWLIVSFDAVYKLETDSTLTCGMSAQAENAEPFSNRAMLLNEQGRSKTLWTKDLSATLNGRKVQLIGTCMKRNKDGGKLRETSTAYDFLVIEGYHGDLAKAEEHFKNVQGKKSRGSQR